MSGRTRQIHRAWSASEPEPGIHLRNTRSCTDCNPEAKGVCTSHRSSHSEWLRQARTRSTRSGPCYCAHCSHMLGNHFLLMWARLSRGLAHISSETACIQTPVVCVRARRPTSGLYGFRTPWRAEMFHCSGSSRHAARSTRSGSGPCGVPRCNPWQGVPPIFRSRGSGEGGGRRSAE